MTTNLTAAVLADGKMLVGAAHAGQHLKNMGTLEGGCVL